MRTLKVWCEDCEGTRERVHHPLGTMRACDTCGGLGFTYREVVELPGGPVAVVMPEAMQEVARILKVVYNAGIAREYPPAKGYRAEDIALALLPGIEFAEAVGEPDWDCDGTVFVHDEGGGPALRIDGTRRIAVLRKEVGT